MRLFQSAWEKLSVFRINGLRYKKTDGDAHRTFFRDQNLYIGTAKGAEIKNDHCQNNRGTL